jgi:5-methylcytosine-specific restriction protein A
MKHCNFLRLDPSYAGTGLRGGGKQEEEIWSEFADDRERLQNIADAIRRSAGDLEEIQISTPEIDEEMEAPEGRLLFRQHKNRERKASLVKKKKALALQRSGELACEVCGFVFERHYGSLGEGFIEFHHKIPLPELRPDQSTRLRDLALVCSNCHRMLHRGGEMLTIDALRGMVRS